MNHAIAAVAALCAAALLAGSAGAKAEAKGPSGWATVASFPSGTFAESLAIDARGSIYVTVTDWANATGYLERIARDGTARPLASLPTGDCCLTGVVLDARGRIYVADATFGAEGAPSPGVFRFDRPDHWTQVLTLPAESFPNGLAFHGRWLYVSDSTRGAIWRTDPTTITDATTGTPWLEDAGLLAPEGFGANGLAFWKDDLFVAVADAGSILRVPIRTHGTPGTPTQVIQDAALVTADGIAFDVMGSLYVTVNGGDPTQGAPEPAPALWRLGSKGALEQIDTPELSYPTMPVFGTTPATAKTLYVENGGYFDGKDSIIAGNIGVHGIPLPQ